jgi:hypothetical protein
VIIVSESSAKVTLRVRTERCAPVRSRSSAAHNDTLRYADARPISVHTEEVTGSNPVSPTLFTQVRELFSVVRPVPVDRVSSICHRDCSSPGGLPPPGAVTSITVVMPWTVGLGQWISHMLDLAVVGGSVVPWDAVPAYA